MSITSVLTIDGTSYTAAQRAGASILPTGLTRVLEGGYDSFTFWEIPTRPAPSFVTGLPVSLTIDIGDGAGSVVRFAGVIDDCQSEHGALGWGHAYTCQSLKFLADRVPVTAVDGTGTQIYNRSPLDDFYTPSDAGLALGEIIRRILTIPATAQALNAIGIGGYTGLPSAPVLPAATLADLALLTIVPPRPVVLQGEGVFNMLDQEAQQWMPKFFSEITPQGEIRFKDLTDAATFVPRTITCPSATAAGDPVTPPRVQRSTKQCATRLIMRGGPLVEVAALSLVDGTLAEVFTSGDKTAWNLTFFTAPHGASDWGTVTAQTSTSATLQSHDATATWAINFWSTRQGSVTLIDSIGSLLSQFETRLVTSNNALSAGGTSTVNWDATWPITGTAYDKYRITGGSGGLTDCWRTYAPREPLTGHTGLNTWVGAHLVTRAAHAVRVATADQTFGVYYTTAIVKGGSLGQEMPAIVQVVPSQGMFRFAQPTVSIFGQTGNLNAGSPTTFSDGLPIDVVIYALYSRGPLSVVVPPDVAGVPQYEGTAYTEDGVTVTKYIDFPAWLWANDTTSFGDLAQQVLDTTSAAEVDLDISWYLTPGGPVPAWDFLAFDYSINVAIAGQSSPWSGMNAPVRAISVRWDWTGQGTQMLGLHASTRKRAYAGFDLYIHPQFAEGSPLVNAFTSENSHGNYQEFNQSHGINADQTQGQGNYQQVNESLAKNGPPGVLTPGQITGNTAGVDALASMNQGGAGAVGGMNQAAGGAVAGMNQQVAGAVEGMNHPGAPQAGFTFADTLAAGKDYGQGVHDPATDPTASARARANAAGDDSAPPQTRVEKELEHGRQVAKIMDRNDAKAAQKAEAVAAMKKRGREKANRGNLERKQIADRNDRKPIDQWASQIDARMDATFPPTDPLNE